MKWYEPESGAGWEGEKNRERKLREESMGEKGGGVCVRWRGLCRRSTGPAKRLAIEALQGITDRTEWTAARLAASLFALLQRHSSGQGLDRGLAELRWRR